MFDALSDPHKWLVPEVILAGLAVLGTIITIYLMRRYKMEAEQPIIRAQVSPRDQTGWHRCELNIRNRLDAPIRFKSAKVIPEGFLMARAQLQNPGGILDQQTVSAILSPDWAFPAREEGFSIFDKVIFLRPTDKAWLFSRERAVKISFVISVLDAERRDISMKVKTNKMFWRD